MSIPGEIIEARVGWTEGLRDRLPPGAHVVVVGACSTHCLEGRQVGLVFRDTIAIATEQGFLAAAVFRLPFEGTVAEQVTKTGTGGLWIDGCRIGSPVLDAERRTSPRINSKPVHDGGWAAIRPEGERHNSLGRWPTNILFVHQPCCVCDGTKRVRTSSNSQGKHAGVTLDRETPQNAFGVFKSQSGTTHLGEDGKEVVASWTCEPGCPVAALDAMSGAVGGRWGSKPVISTTSKTASTYGERARLPENPDFHGDSGGASRFYPQFPDHSMLTAWLGRLINGSAESPV